MPFVNLEAVTNRKRLDFIIIMSINGNNWFKLITFPH